MADRKSRFSREQVIDITPLPSHIPKVDEIGASSAPLLSAAYFIGARCQPYNDDFMKCKTDSNGRGELECLKEGRKVTRCAQSVLADVNAHCLKEFREHWDCLENNNHQLWQCRRKERPLNQCVFASLNLEKTIPGTPEGVIPVHLRSRQIFANPGGLTFLGGGASTGTPPPSKSSSSTQPA